MIATQLPTVPQATSPYSLRDAPGRLGLVTQQGGSGRTESAVSDALRWLASAQARDGRWDADEHGAGQEQLVLNQNRGGAGRNADTAVSALALLAFLGAGHSHVHGDYQDTVRRGIDFLLRSQAADGSLFGESTLYAQMYCHAMATFALAEAQAMTGDQRLEPAVKKAVHFSIAAQNPSVGGWRYRPGDSGDTSQLGWQLMALASAERAGVAIPANTWARVARFLTIVRRGPHGGLASYRPDGPASTSMTAEALYCRLLLSDLTGDAVDETASREATDNLLASLPTAERVNLYYWYYATLALHHRHAQNERAAQAWQTWNDAMVTAIIATQVSDGPNAGSWKMNTIWGGYGGRIYTTAMATMCLEVYYRYAPVPPERNRWTASRPGTPKSGQ
jgi:squalene cyclase